MNVTLETKTLAEAVGLLTAMQSKHLSSAMPVLGHVLITDTAKGTVTFSVTDLELSARISLPNRQPIPAGAEPDSISVPLSVLSQQTKSMAALSDGVVLKKTESLRLILKTGKTRAQIHGINPNEFTPLPWLLPDADVVLCAKDLQHLLKSTLSTADPSQFNQNALTGVNLTALDGRVQTASTDEKRMTCAMVPLVRSGSVFSVFLPKALAFYAMRVASRLDPEDTVAIAKDGNHIFAWSQNTILACRQMGGRKFPDLSVWLKMDADRRIVLPIADLDSVLSAAFPFAVSEQTDGTARLYLEYSDGVLNLKCRNDSAGEFEAELPVQAIDVDSFKFVVNGFFVRDALASMKSIGDEVAITPPAATRGPLHLRPAKGMTTSEEVRSWIAGMV